MRKDTPETAPAPAPVTPPAPPAPTPKPPSGDRFLDKNGLFLINRKGLELVKHFESGTPDRWEHYLTAYIDPVGVPTIGFGHIRTVTRADVTAKKKISMAEAERLLMEDLFEEGAKYVRSFLVVENKLNDDQFSSLVSFTYNRGAGRFNEKMDDVVDAALLDGKITSSEFMEISNLLMHYNFAISNGKKSILTGLTRRRAAEAALFMGKDWTVFKGTDWRKYLNTISG